MDRAGDLAVAGDEAGQVYRHHRHVRPEAAALRAHVSQTAHMDNLETMASGWLGENARVAGLPDGHLAEAFAVYQMP